MVSPSHITATLFIVPFILIVLGSDLGSSYVAKATDFYWVMSFPVGTGATTSLPGRALRPALQPVEPILIFSFGSQTKAGMAHTHRSEPAIGAQAFYR